MCKFRWKGHLCVHPTCTSFLAPSFSTLSIKSSNCSLGNNLWAQFSIFCISRRRSSAWLYKDNDTLCHMFILCWKTTDSTTTHCPQMCWQLLPHALCPWNEHYQTACAELEVLFLRSAWRQKVTQCQIFKVKPRTSTDPELDWTTWKERNIPTRRKPPGMVCRDSFNASISLKKQFNWVSLILSQYIAAC